eukprot:2657987-Amphidinium_carterae.2
MAAYLHSLVICRIFKTNFPRQFQRKGYMSWKTAHASCNECLHAQVGAGSHLLALHATTT